MTILIRRGLFLLLILSITGCGTISNRVETHDYSANYYKGTQFDFQLLFFGEGVGGSLSAICWFSIACPVLTVLSIPADIVVDTILLPYDIHTKKQREATN